MRKRKVTDAPVWNQSVPKKKTKEFRVIKEEEEEDGEWEPEEVRIPPPPPSGEVSTPTAAAYRSVCTSSEAKRYAIEYKVPPEYGLCAPTARQRAHDPPPGYAAIYGHHFRHGLRLPLPPFVVSLLAHYGIALAQLHPICIFPILGFMEICNKVSVSPTPTLFRHFFRFRKSKETEGWYTFSSIPPKIVYGQPSGVHKWKESFLFFKTTLASENVTLSWNHSPVVDPPLAENERPSKQTVSRLLANANRSSKGKRAYIRCSSKRKRAAVEKEEERIEADSSMASVPKSCKPKKKAVAQREAKKSSKVNEPTLIPCPTVKPKTSCRLKSTESPSSSCKPKKKAVAQKEAKKSSKVNEPTLIPCPTVKPKTYCRLKSTELPSSSCKPKKKAVAQKEAKKLKRKAEPLAAKPSKTLRGATGKKCVDLVKVVAALEQDVKDKDHEISSLKAELEKVMVAMEQGFKDKDSEIASLARDKEEMAKVVEAMEHGLKDKDSKIASLHGEKEELKKGMVAMEQGSKDKGNKVPLPQGGRDREKFVKVVAAMVQGIKDKVSEIAHAN